MKYKIWQDTVRYFLFLIIDCILDMFTTIEIGIKDMFTTIEDRN